MPPRLTAAAVMAVVAIALGLALLYNPIATGEAAPDLVGVTMPHADDATPAPIITAAPPGPTTAPGATSTPDPGQFPTLTATAAPAPTPAPPAFLDGDPAPRLAGELVMQTFSVDFYRMPGAMQAETIRAMAMPIEQSILTTTARIGLPWLGGRVAVRFEPPQRGACAIRGLTLSHERTIRLFYAPDTDPRRVVAIMAHELFHQLQHDYYGWPAHRRSDVILLEGMATWGSSPYFLDEEGQPAYRSAVQRALAEDTLLPLTTSLEADCRTTTRVNIYNEWASFVEYLFVTYGRERLDQVYTRSTGRAAGSADYRGVYGKDLGTLEADWIAWLRSP